MPTFINLNYSSEQFVPCCCIKRRALVECWRLFPVTLATAAAAAKASAGEAGSWRWLRAAQCYYHCRQSITRSFPSHRAETHKFCDFLSISTSVANFKTFSNFKTKKIKIQSMFVLVSCARSHTAFQSTLNSSVVSYRNSNKIKYYKAPYGHSCCLAIWSEWPSQPTPGEFWLQFPRVSGEGQLGDPTPPGWPLSSTTYSVSLHNLTLEDAIELALNKPLWRLLAASGATHWWCMPNNNDDDTATNMLFKITMLQLDWELVYDSQPNQLCHM